MKNKKIKRKLKIKTFIKFIIVIVLIVISSYYLFNLPIKNIYIKGNNYLSDGEIISAAKIKNYPRLFKFSSNTIKKNIKKLDLISSCKVKKSLFGKVVIEVEEESPLFYNRNDSIYVLSNGKKTNDYEFIGIPYLVNYVPDNIYERLVKNFQKIDNESIKMISEIEYSPSKSKDVVIDDTRFILRMNDGNIVYINLINIDRLNSYHLIYSALHEKGILELDSDNENVVFKSYKSIENSKKDDGKENEE